MRLHMYAVYGNETYSLRVPAEVKVQLDNVSLDMKSMVSGRFALIPVIGSSREPGERSLGFGSAAASEAFVTY